jgi:hypothetical protein
MPKFAVVENDAVARYVEGIVLPVFDEIDEVGESEVLGPVETIIETDRVLHRRRARRALSGLVAIVGEGGSVEFRDLGVELVAVADNVLPVEDARPELQDGKTYGEPTIAVQKNVVRRTFPLINIPPAPTAAEKLAAAGLTVEDLRSLLAR